jgi:cytochrome c oxidase subunit 2
LELRADDDNIDLVVQVEGQRFSWLVKYPEHNVQSRSELVLPVDENVQFLVMASDVIHSLWIPGFRVKIDAVPGLTTKVTATPNIVGSYEKDVNFRLQCAELCGAGHAVMRMPVRVVERAEFDEWLSEQRPISARR